MTVSSPRLAGKPFTLTLAAVHSVWADAGIGQMNNSAMANIEPDAKRYNVFGVMSVPPITNGLRDHSISRNLSTKLRLRYLRVFDDRSTRDPR
jgi:hypothetical protein